MTYVPNTVQHAALESRGAGQLALHLHFERPHDRMSLGFFLGQLATYLQGQDGVFLLPEIHSGGEVISLVPNQPIAEVRHFETISRELGYDPPSGELSFIQRGSCLPIEGTSRLEH